jgi:23S rRNA (uracil1939-C5)-methyltransferase
MGESVLENLLITDIADRGQAVAEYNGMIVFTKNAVPGDVVDVRLMKKKKSYALGSVINYRQKSPFRTEPFCKHFGICGGCKWQNLDYERQLLFKEKQVRDAFTHIAGIINPSLLPILGSAQIKHYRNRLDFTFSNRRWLTEEELKNISPGREKGSALGFHIPGRFDQVFDVNECHLQPEPSNAIRLETKKFALENKMAFYDLRHQKGMLRNLVIRNAGKDRFMVIVIFFEEDEALRNALLVHLKNKFPHITSLLYAINPKKNDTFYDLNLHCFSGTEFLEEKMTCNENTLQFQIGPKSFFQTNTLQAQKLYETALNFASLSEHEIVYDLYTGTGTIACFAALSAKKVVGIEYNEESINHARQNARFNKISNAEFFSGDLKDLLQNDFFDRHGKPDVIITDPPRAGMHNEVTNQILKSQADRIIYVSCNPATQARDVKILMQNYALVKIQPVDMFPHTHHVENVALLEKIR